MSCLLFIFVVVESLEFSSYIVMMPANTNSFTYKVPIFFFCLIVLVSKSNTILNICESGYLCLVSNFKGECLMCFPTNYTSFCAELDISSKKVPIFSLFY